MHARYTYIQFTSTPLNNTQIDCIHCIQHCPVLKAIPSDPGWARTATKKGILGSLSRTTMHRAAKRATMRRAAGRAADTIFFLWPQRLAGKKKTGGSGILLPWTFGIIMHRGTLHRQLLENWSWLESLWKFLNIHFPPHSMRMAHGWKLDGFPAQLTSSKHLGWSRFAVEFNNAHTFSGEPMWNFKDISATCEMHNIQGTHTKFKTPEKGWTETSPNAPAHTTYNIYIHVYIYIYIYIYLKASPLPPAPLAARRCGVF